MKNPKYCISALVPACLGLTLTLILVGAPAEAQCIRFEGIDHCPIGDSHLTLALDGSQLIAAGADPTSGSDLMSIFPPADQWSCQFEVSGEASESVSVISVTEGGETSTATFGFGVLETVLEATFTGSQDGNPFTAELQYEGTQVASIQGVRSESLTIAANLPISHPTFAVLPNGACQWIFSLPSPVAVTLPEGTTALADEIRLTEEVVGPGHYPYVGVTAMKILSTSSQIVLHEEQVNLQ